MLNDLSGKSADYKHEIEMLNEGWQVLDDRLEENERNDRLGVLILEGLKHSKEGTLKTHVCNTIKKYMDINIKDTDMIHCYRFGEDGQESGLPRQVKIRFKDPTIKQAIMRLRGNLRQTGIFLKEHLTTRQHNIFYQARESKRLGHIDKAWTIDGRVWG